MKFIGVDIGIITHRTRFRKVTSSMLTSVA